MAEQEGPIIYHHLFTEEAASSVRLQENLENIGARVDFLVFTDANDTEQK